MATKKTLTHSEFESIRQHLSQMKARSIDIAYDVLVNGAKQTDLAEKHGITTKAVSQMVGTVWKTFLEHGSRPKGWVSLDVCLPPEMAKVVKQMEEAALQTVKEKK